MAKIILIQALPAPRLDSRENLTRALTLLQGCQDQEADLICFPEYFPFRGEEELAAAARLQVHIIAGRVEETDGRRYITVNLDLEGPRRWRPVIRKRFGITG
jgi:predicted amidohydrolase